MERERDQKRTVYLFGGLLPGVVVVGVVVGFFSGVVVAGVVVVVGVVVAGVVAPVCVPLAVFAAGVVVLVVAGAAMVGALGCGGSGLVLIPATSASMPSTEPLANLYNSSNLCLEAVLTCW